VFLRYVHNFRAVAICFIVAGHVVFTLGHAAHPRMMDLLADALDYGTVLFLFIAGFLFEHLSGTFEYRGYLRRKLRNVIAPYLVTSVPAVVYVAWFTPGDGHSPWYRAAVMLATGVGSPDYAVWFIPMIALFYLAAPLLMRFVRHPRLYWLIVPLLVFSALAHRPPELWTPVIAVYFLPVYLLGMWVSHARERIEPVVRRWWPALLAAFAAAVVVRWLWSPWHGGEYAHGLFTGEFGLVDWMLLMKVLFCFALMGIMLRADRVIGDRLSFLGTASFTVFFLHCYLLLAFVDGWAALGRGVAQGDAVSVVALTLAVVGVALAAAALVRRLAGPRSRMLIGC
jgi:surface polysaccharide O-acyltransferase-like enzyme